MGDELTVEQPRRGRPPRKEAEQRERRRRPNNHGRRDPLALTIKKDPDYRYRWINDDPGRVHSLTVEDDWDVVTAIDNKEGGNGTVIERPVDRTGKRGVLVRKRKEWFDEDKAKAQESVAASEEQIKHGAHGAGGLGSHEGYVPPGAISIGQR